MCHCQLVVCKIYIQNNDVLKKSLALQDRPKSEIYSKSGIKQKSKRLALGDFKDQLECSSWIYKNAKTKILTKYLDMLN